MGMNPTLVLLLVGLFGALGAWARFATAVGMNHWLGEGFPWGTLAVNVLGCFCLGCLAHFGEQYLSREWKLILGVGFLGALTTFSTFGLETVTRWNAGQAWIALTNVFCNLFFGLLAVWLGIWLAEFFTARGHVD